MRNLPMGKMTGADWKRMVDGVDLSHLDDAKTYYRDQIAYTVKEPDTISGDLFIGTEHEVPQTTGKALSRQGKATHRRAGASPNVIAVRQAPDVEGIYYVTTQLVAVGERDLPVDRVGSWEDAAKVFANLSRYAVEHFDALVTDKNGKPLAIIGGFKGSPTQAAVYPGTVMMELARIDGAANLWMGHNHPSGTPDLSTLTATCRAPLRRSSKARTSDITDWLLSPGKGPMWRGRAAMTAAAQPPPRPREVQSANGRA